MKSGIGAEPQVSMLQAHLLRMWFFEIIIGIVMFSVSLL